MRGSAVIRYYDAASTAAKPIWYTVDLEFVERFPAVVPLETLKQTRGLEEMMVIQKGSRLSVQPVTRAEFAIVTRLGRRAGLTARIAETQMEYRQLGSSGLKVPILTFGTGTFGGQTDFFKPWGASDVKEATRLVDVCLDAGLTMFDSADVYSQGQSEEILGRAIAGRRDRVLISTKGTFRSGDGPNDVGSSRFHIMKAVDASLKRLGTDYIDLYQLHGFDAQTPSGKRCVRSTISCAQARSATSALPTSRAGT